MISRRTLRFFAAYHWQWPRMGTLPMHETPEATAIFAPLWRYKWLILAIAVLVGVATYLYYKRQTPTYQSTTQIYLGGGAEESAGERTSKRSAAAIAGDQTTLISTLVVPEVRRR